MSNTPVMLMLKSPGKKDILLLCTRGDLEALDGKWFLSDGEDATPRHVPAFDGYEYGNDFIIAGPTRTGTIREVNDAYVSALANGATMLCTYNFFCVELGVWNEVLQFYPDMTSTNVFTLVG